MDAPRIAASESDSSVRSVERAAKLIKLLAAQAGGSRLSDLAAATSLGKSTAHRILAALAEQGFVYQRPDNRRYVLGYELIRLARASALSAVADVAKPSLERIAGETGDVVFLQIKQGAEAICLDRHIGSFPIKSLTLNIGDRRPLGIGAGSLALLFSLPDEEIEQVLAKRAADASYPRFTPEVLRALIVRSREAGYAYNEGLIVSGMGAVGVPVFDAGGRLTAAISVAAIHERMAPERRQWIVSLLQAEAEKIRIRIEAVPYE